MFWRISVLNPPWRKIRHEKVSQIKHLLWRLADWRVDFLMRNMTVKSIACDVLADWRIGSPKGEWLSPPYGAPAAIWGPMIGSRKATARSYRARTEKRPRVRVGVGSVRGHSAGDCNVGADDLSRGAYARFPQFRRPVIVRGSQGYSPTGAARGESLLRAIRARGPWRKRPRQPDALVEPVTTAGCGSTGPRRRS